MDFDCPRNWCPDRDEVLLDPHTYRQVKLKRASEAIDYHTFEYDKEVKRTEERNAWIAQLRRSLDNS